MNDLVEQIAAQKLGEATTQQVQQQVAQDAAQAEAAQQPPTPGADSATPAPTEQEQANAAISPKTEGDRQADSSYITVDFGDGDVRTMSDMQVRETMKRYKDLNYKHQTQYAPMSAPMDFINEIAGNLQAQGQDVNGDEIAQFLRAASQAFVSNPTMGGQVDPTPDTMGIPLDALEQQMAAWEDENAVSLPPMYKDAARQMGQLQSENQEIKQMLAQIAGQAGDLNMQAAEQVKDAAMQQNNAARQQAANNLNVAQQKYQLPDQDEQDFFNFAFERGYTIEDFIDPRLTDMVMADFSNNRNGPEMDRLRQMAARRQAYTGQVGATPAAGGQPEAPSQDEQFIGAVAQQAMQRRNMV
jgi:hypothetical protein